jgi:hypothetical protein
MDWREAFLRQARSDIALLLSHLTAAEVEYAHRLHYIQMGAEKLAKGFLHPSGANAPPLPTHAALVRMLRVIKGREDIRRMLGYPNRESYRAYIDSLLPLAQRIQDLAPAIAGFTRPNPEYPWRTPAAPEVSAPCEFTFNDFDPRRPDMAKFVKLLNDLARIAS